MKSWNHFLFSWTVPLFSTQQKSQVGPIYPRNLTVSWLSPWKASPCFHRRPEVVLQGNLLFVCPLQSGVTTRAFPKISHWKWPWERNWTHCWVSKVLSLSLSLYIYICLSFLASKFFSIQVHCRYRYQPNLRISGFRIQISTQRGWFLVSDEIWAWDFWTKRIRLCGE